ncbi:MAG TPA: GNAT family N-acetyltransferase [Sporolactobacillaceae bacterium]|nr:GNAT family N-acetyltransferase [Sporolactobacillaceae bacterium]
MIEVRKLSTLTLDEALETWNKGFEGYVYDQKMSLDQFIQRFGNEGLSPELSVVAFVDGEPAGLVLNGLRTVNGKKVSWNGGTGVAVKYRRTGVGKALMEETLKLYRENDVDIATLEAAKSNIKAISLYKQYGYDLIDDLVFLQNKEPLSKDSFTFEENPKGYTSRRGHAHEAGSLPIINHLVPWQTHWLSLRRDGELLVIEDQGEAVGYFLFKKQYDDSGKPTALVLFSAGLAPNRPDAEDIARYGFGVLFGPHDVPMNRATFNFPSSNIEIVALLKELGFTPYTEQVFMVKHLK